MDTQKVKKTFSIAGRVLSIMLVVLEVLIIIFLVISKVQGTPPTLFGYQMYFIRTGSMSPYLEPGDVIISKKYDGGELIAGKDGDVVIWNGDPLIEIGTTAYITVVDGKIVYKDAK